MNEHRHGVFLIMAQGMLDCMELSDLPAAIRSYMKTDGHDIDTGLSKSIDLLNSIHLVISCPQQNGGITAMVHWPFDIPICPIQLPRRHSCQSSQKDVQQFMQWLALGVHHQGWSKF